MVGAATERCETKARAFLGFHFFSYEVQRRVVMEGGGRHEMKRERESAAKTGTEK